MYTTTVRNSARLCAKKTPIIMLEKNPLIIANPGVRGLSLEFVYLLRVLLL
jgi:hypothetical protein